MTNCIRVAAVVLLAILLSACQTAPKVFNREQPVRYAAQWKTYIGATEGEEIDLMFAFLDKGGGDAAKRRFDGLTLLTNKQPVRATVQPGTPSATSLDGGFYSIRARTQGLTVGRYSFSEIQYLDETGQQRTISVGEWVIEVVPKQAPDLATLSSMIASSDFSSFPVVLHNQLPRPVTAMGLKFQLPSLPDVSSEMLTYGNGQDTSSSGSSGATSGSDESEETLPTPAPTIPADRVVIEPGKERELFFQFVPEGISRQAPFIQLQPLLRYRVDGSPEERMYALENVAYSDLLMGRDGIDDYLSSLPEGAKHPLP